MAAKKKSIKEQYEAARATFRKTNSATAKKKFLDVRQKYIEQRQESKTKK